MTSKCFKQIAVIFSALCLVACSGDDGVDGLNGADGTNAAEQIVIATETLAPGETMTVAHDFANYSADLAFEYNGARWDHSEFGLVYNPANDFETPFAVIGEPDSQAGSRVDVATFRSTSDGYAAYLIQESYDENFVVTEHALIEEIMNREGEVQAFEVLLRETEAGYLENVFYIQALETSSGVLTLLLAGDVDYIMTFVDNQLGEVLNDSTLEDLNERGEGWQFSQGYSNQQYAAMLDGGTIVACIWKPDLDVDLGVDRRMTLQSFSIAADGSISLGNQVVVSETPEQYDAADCVVSSRPQGGVAAFFEREGDFYSEIWAAMYDANLESEMEAIVADNYIGHRTISCNTQDICIAGYEQGGPDLYNYAAFSLQGVLERAVLDDNEGDYLSSTALADDVFLLSTTEDDSQASYLWVISPDGTQIQEPHLMSPFRAVDDDRRNTLLPATGNNARFFYNTYESSNVSNYVSVTVSQNRLAEVREAGQYLVTNKSLHTVEVIVTLTGTTD